MLKKRSTLGPKIDDDVHHGTPRTPNQLALGGWGVLEMQASQGTLRPIEANIRLSYHWLQIVRSKLVLAEGSRKETAIITSARQLDDICAL
jgi:hypothetical protein